MRNGLVANNLARAQGITGGIINISHRKGTWSGNFCIIAALVKTVVIAPGMVAAIYPYFQHDKLPYSGRDSLWFL